MEALQRAKDEAKEKLWEIEAEIARRKGVTLDEPKSKPHTLLCSVLDHGGLQEEIPERKALLCHPLRLNGEKGALAVPMNALTLITGQGGVGKSNALLQLAVSIITGVDWLSPDQSTRGVGFQVDPDQVGKSVAVIMAEEDVSEMKRRLQNIIRVYELSTKQIEQIEERLHIAGLSALGFELVKVIEDEDEGENGIKVKSTEDFDDFTRALRQIAPEGTRGLAAVILDPIVHFIPPGDENDNTVASRFMRVMQGWTRLPGEPAVILAHHSNKSSSKNPHLAGAARGASALTTTARCQLNLYETNIEKEDPNEREIKIAISKSNYGPKGRPKTLMREKGVLVCQHTTLPEGPEDATSQTQADPAQATGDRRNDPRY
jgi:RecA-family ATPase